MTDQKTYSGIAETVIPDVEYSDATYQTTQMHRRENPTGLGSEVVSTQVERPKPRDEHRPADRLKSHQVWSGSHDGKAAE